MILTQEEKLKYEEGIREIRDFLLKKIPLIRDSVAVKWFDERTEKKAYLMLTPFSKDSPLNKSTTWEIDDCINLYYNGIRYNFKILSDTELDYEKENSILNFDTNNDVGLSLMQHWNELKITLLGLIQEQKNVISVLNNFTI